MEEFIYYNSLFDIYGSLLTEKECLTFKDYYHEDLSLAEIALEKNVSRSAVYKTLKNVIDKLNYYEERLHVYQKNEKLQNLLKINNLSDMKRTIREILDE